MATDNGYISKYLIHWAGQGHPDQQRAEILSSIASTCQLLLSQGDPTDPNDLFFDGSIKIVDRMVCFTDVPLVLSADHCRKYSPFGIAFHKLALINQGAQPVFYFTHVFQRDMSTIYKFILQQLENTTLDPNVFRAIHRHFYYMKKFSDSRADRTDTNYYEREWRVGELSLLPEGENRGRWCLNNKLPTSIGNLVFQEGKPYFRFHRSDVSFLVAPKSYFSSIRNPHRFTLKAFEELVKSGAEEEPKQGIERTV